MKFYCTSTLDLLVLEECFKISKCNYHPSNLGVSCVLPMSIGGHGGKILTGSHEHDALLHLSLCQNHGCKQHSLVAWWAVTQFLIRPGCIRERLLSRATGFAEVSPVRRRQSRWNMQHATEIQVPTIQCTIQHKAQ